MKEKKQRAKTTKAHRPLMVWSERRAEPDWDRYVAALVALSLRRVEERREENPTQRS